MAKRKTKSINLALQGGGAHGAFTWGVLECLLEDERVEIAGISGTSAGALNGAALKAGMIERGRDGAIDKLAWLWGEIGAVDHPSMQPWIAGMAGVTPSAVSKSLEYSPVYMWFDAISRLSSPYNLGVLYENPLRRIVDQFSYDKICTDDGPELYVCATNVRSGKIKIFYRDTISTDAILASGCLPTVFQAVEITDPKSGVTDAYWDGGYMGNPALFPLFSRDLPKDIVVVNINPLYRETIPKTPQEIHNRINEISFNGSLFRELRAIDFAQRLLEQGRVGEEAMKHPLIHMIADDGLMRQLSVATKIVPNNYVMTSLREAGKRQAKEFLSDHFDTLGASNSVDLREMFS